ncbi:hypothetical protein [Rhodoblastus sp.]|uniref:hypothetical protein n=1 Tax=Rhodoblastus sp. TaxID=1962975 RepID=UPI0026291ED8|nr:hypothetical protein [Rhodoblastus sp.]
MNEPVPSLPAACANIWLWLAAGLAVTLGGGALALWAAYGPVVFVNTLNAAWTCL